MLVALDLDRLALAAGNFDGDDLLGKMPSAARLGGALLRAQGKRVLVGAGDLESSATFSAVSGMASTPYRAFISGLTKRQPMVVS